MTRRFAAIALALCCAACSKTEQSAGTPPPKQPPAAPSEAGKSGAAAARAQGSADAVVRTKTGEAADTSAKAPGNAKDLAGAPAAKDTAVAVPVVSEMRGAASRKPIPVPAPAGPPPAVPPAHPPLLGSSEPVVDGAGVERISLVPGGKVAPQPEGGPVVAHPVGGATAAAPAAGEPADAEAAVGVAANAVRPEVTVTSGVPEKAAMAVGPSILGSPAVVREGMGTNGRAKPSNTMMSLSDPTRAITTINDLVLDCVANMPPGGEYRADGPTMELLRAAVTVQDRHLQVVPDLARPSFCSAATYLVFLQTLDRLHRANRLRLPGPVLEALLVHGQHDGEGVWGRWNANGPGTARLFHELGLGRSFEDLSEARPGDFLKIWWNDEIGARERGHSVIFLGTDRADNGEPGVRYWSSNKPGGYSVAVAPMSKVKRMLFSRLDNPRGLADAPRLPLVDKYLADMLKRASSEEEMCRLCGVGLPGR